MATFVLVHGHYLGVWAWEDVVSRLEAAGHRAIAASLTGMGERTAEASLDTGLRTHVDDVAGLLTRGEFRDVVLVGHSYAGLIIAGVAACVGDRVRTLVYLDAVVPRHGQRLLDFLPTSEDALASSADHRGLIPSVDPRVAGLAGNDAVRAERLFTPVPLGTFTQRLDAPGDPAWAGRSHYILCRQFPFGAPIAEALRGKHGWTVSELDAGHLPMISHPGELTELLLQAV
jgi:pimeloyl-ACP methyl ester carboxylesterase